MSMCSAARKIKPMACIYLIVVIIIFKSTALHKKIKRRNLKNDTYYAIYFSYLERPVAQEDRQNIMQEKKSIKT